MNIPYEMLIDEMFTETIYRVKSLDEAVDTRSGKSISVEGFVSDYLLEDDLIIELEDGDSDVLTVEYSPFTGLSKKELVDIIEDVIDRNKRVKLYGIIEEDKNSSLNILKLHGLQVIDEQKTYPSSSVLEEAEERFPGDKDFVEFQEGEKEFLKLINNSSEQTKNQLEREYAIRSSYQKFLDAYYRLTEVLNKKSEELITLEEKNSPDKYIPENIK